MEFSRGQIILANIAILVSDAIKYWPALLLIFIILVLVYLNNRYKTK